ncbi:DUF881 domain-containing protein [Brachybacterium sacelli]|uniref:Uncharacterized protein YlxW (UPF0749 family) n=1 Tax=Brachybacterium sacelli TaxID=173364 RepID=A0ABS4WV63_9MICO|nr:DUF881 domain-containing protein [Brachybacterium sacelli]MBP2380089.1 uncharacterized protein YlxW (UPF0749 family) [Brachybacterium sacelli]
MVEDAGRTRGPRRGLGVALVMVLCGVLFATTARISGGGSIRDESGDVAGVLRERGRTIEQLTDEAADKRAEIERLSAEGGDAATQERSTRVSEAVGLSEVSGPALQITLTDAPTSTLGSMPDVEPDDLVVHQQDMESYINALWAGGAEAMMLQDQRVVGGSAFRCAGNTLLLEGRVYSPPFVITVIGPTEQMLAALDDTSGVQIYREWVDHVGLGEQIKTLEETTLPGFEGSLTLETAQAG